MNNFCLEEPTIKRKDEAIEYIEEHKLHNSLINGESGLDNYLANYEQWLELIESYKKTDTCPENRCPSYVYFLIRKNDDKIIGMITIRYNLSEGVLLHGGHIGYGIRPLERGNKYSKVILYLGLEKCENIGLSKVILTALDSNVASCKTILSLGGILQNKILNKNNEYMGRYEIDVKKSLLKYKNNLLGN